MATNNQNYQKSDMMSMQQDAIRRVREMQRKANLNVHQNNPNNNYNQIQNNYNTSQNSNNNYIPKETPKDDTSFKENSSSLDFLKNLNLDREKIIIILLIIVLLNEGASQKTILALAYLLL